MLSRVLADLEMLSKESWLTWKGWAKSPGLPGKVEQRVLAYLEQLNKEFWLTWKVLPGDPGCPRITAHGQDPGLARVPPIILVPLLRKKDSSLSCKASKRALLPPLLRTDIRMRLIALQWQTRWQWAQQDVDHKYISFSIERLWQAGN